MLAVPASFDVANTAIASMLRLRLMLANSLLVLCVVAQNSFATTLRLTSDASDSTTNLSANESVSFVIDVANEGPTSSLPEDRLAGWQVLLQITPSASAAGEITFGEPIQTEPRNYIFSDVGHLGISSTTNGEFLRAFDANFPFSGGVTVPESHAGLFEFEVRTSDDASGQFEVVALGGPNQSEWTNAVTPVQRVRRFDNVGNDGFVVARLQVGAAILVGDFDANGVVDVIDIDLLSRAIRENSEDTQFDLDESGDTNFEDLRFMIDQVIRSYFGDANLDGEFNTSDFILVFQENEYEDGIPGNSTWSTGDWNGNGDFETGDFILAFQSDGYEKGRRTRFQNVPEPTYSLPIVLLTLLALARSTLCSAVH